jgi:hypothetical protein
MNRIAITGMIRTTQRLITMTILVGCMGIPSCQKHEKEAEPSEMSSFDLIQDHILTKSCATSGCHAAESDGSFKQHGLVLAKGVAYKNLVGVTPQNEDAKSGGLLRVKAFQSEMSLLYHKLEPNSNAHHSGKNYGSYMPLGGQPLFAGEIEFVRRWIVAGAPEKGTVVDEKLLEDKTLSTVPDFEPLASPKSGEGYQLKIDLFTIQPDFEREVFVRREIGNPTEIYVNRLVLRSRPNSHHMVLYDFRNRASLPALNEVRDLRSPANVLNLQTVLEMSNHIFLGGGTLANQDYSMPEGAAIKLPAKYSIDLNAHYFNKTTATLYGENYINMYTVDKSKVKNIVQMLDLGNTSLEMLPKTRKTFIKTWTFDKPRQVVMLTSHNHKLGEKFLIRIKGGSRDGQVVYESNDWEHPLIKNFTPALSLAKGEGLTSEITYYNSTDKTVRFGLTSEDEMGIIFGYYFEE